MTAECQQDGFDREEIVMILLLAILIPVMLFAANLDFRRQSVGHAQQASSTIAIRVWGDDPSRIPSPPARFAADTGDKESTEAAIIGSEAALVANTADEQPPSMSSNPEASIAGGNRETSLMDIDFSLADLDGERVQPPTRNDASITVSKVVLVGDQKIGKVDITIESEGTLLLEANAVRALLGQQDDKSAKSLKRLPEQGLVSFAQLRDAGIDLRYLPNEDAIRLNP